MSMDTVKMPVGSGSGFIWDNEGHIVTNFHGPFVGPFVGIVMQSVRPGVSLLAYVDSRLCEPAVWAYHGLLLTADQHHDVITVVINGADDLTVALIDQSIYNAKVTTAPPTPLPQHPCRHLQAATCCMLHFACFM